MEINLVLFFVRAFCENISDAVAFVPDLRQFRITTP
jgi:hypothetical protein